MRLVSPVGTSVTLVEGVRLHRLPHFVDMRGALCVSEFERDLPFLPRRYFVVYNVPSQEIRGEHAHRRCHQFMVCVHGSVRVLADDGSRGQEVRVGLADVGNPSAPDDLGDAVPLFA